MKSRHQVDTSLRFNPDDPQPEQKEIAGQAVYREPYLAGPGLADAVNLAIAIGRPLLLQGDPGTGKTRLAHAVAYALTLPLEEAYVKSTSRAQDLLYIYDAVSRLYDAQVPSPPFPGSTRDTPQDLSPDLGGGPAALPQAAKRPRPYDKYVRLGPLGRAVERAERGQRSVVLIDEIDKADIDFPNDLLRELDQLAFDVDEVPGERYAVPVDRPDLRPIVIVTNNEEKTLPAAFLRRCVFHYIEFPVDETLLDDILSLHGIGDAPLRDAAIDVLLELREIDLVKKPGLSELLDWVGYLQAVTMPPDKLGELPYLGALLKQRSDEIRAKAQLATR
jgi:MoxR-like ATPase